MLSVLASLLESVSPDGEKDDIRCCHPREKRFTALSDEENFIRLTADRVIDQSRHMQQSSQ